MCPSTLRRPPTDQAGGRAQATLCRRECERGHGGEHRAEREPTGLCHIPDQDGERAPGKREPGVGVHQPPEQLPVVGHHEKGAEHQKWKQRPPDAREPDDAQHDRTGQAHDRDADQRRRRNAGSERPPVQFIQGVGRKADREQERQERGHEPAERDVWCQRGADHDVREMPRRVGRVEKRPPVPPSAVARPRKRPDGAQPSAGPPLRVPHITSPPPRLITRTPTSSNPARRQASSVHESGYFR